MKNKTDSWIFTQTDEEFEKGWTVGSDEESIAFGERFLAEL